MSYVKYFLGAAWWRLRAGWWYLTLGLRLFFAVGLDQDFDPAKDEVGKRFRCPYRRNYRRYLNKPVGR